jgi:hypothetical protein
MTNINSEMLKALYGIVAIAVTLSLGVLVVVLCIAGVVEVVQWAL